MTPMKLREMYPSADFSFFDENDNMLTRVGYLLFSKVRDWKHYSMTYSENGEEYERERVHIYV